MQENNAGPRQLDNVKIDSLQIAPPYATNNMVVTVGGQNYLVAGQGGLSNLIRALIMAQTMGRSISFTTTGSTSDQGYGYIGSVTL